MEPELFWSLIIGAVVVETLVAVVHGIQNDARWQYWAGLIGGLIAGELIAINYDIDLFKLVGLDGRIPFVGAVLTGLIISRGSSVVRDVIGKLISWKDQRLGRTED